MSTLTDKSGLIKSLHAESKRSAIHLHKLRLTGHLHANRCSRNMLDIKRSTDSTTSLLKLRCNALKSCILHQRNHSRSSKHIHRAASHSLRCLIQSHCNLFLTFNTCL